MHISSSSYKFVGGLTEQELPESTNYWTFWSTDAVQGLSQPSFYLTQLDCVLIRERSDYEDSRNWEEHNCNRSHHFVCAYAKGGEWAVQLSLKLIIPYLIILLSQHSQERTVATTSRIMVPSA